MAHSRWIPLESNPEVKTYHKLTSPLFTQTRRYLTPYVSSLIYRSSIAQAEGYPRLAVGIRGRSAKGSGTLPGYLWTRRRGTVPPDPPPLTRHPH